MKRNHIHTLMYCLFGLFVLGSLYSCSGVKNVQINRQLQNQTCHQISNKYATLDALPQPLHSLSLDTTLKRSFSHAALNVAHAFGILPVLEEFVQLHHRSRADTTVRLHLRKLEVANQLQEKIGLASLEIAAFASELDCEEERVTQLADYMKDAEENAETKFTVAAIVVGAAGAIVSGLFLDDGNTADYIGIGTGVAEAALGALIFTNKKKISLSHDRNALQEIWEGNEQPEVFPVSVWYYLNYHNPQQAQQKSLREQIIESWFSFGQISKQSSEKVTALYFGSGGTYSTAKLYNRASMYDQLESFVKIIMQDLMMLSAELQDFK